MEPRSATGAQRDGGAEGGSAEGGGADGGSADGGSADGGSGEGRAELEPLRREAAKLGSLCGIRDATLESGRLEGRRSAKSGRRSLAGGVALLRARARVRVRIRVWARVRLRARARQGQG